MSAPLPPATTEGEVREIFGYPCRCERGALDFLGWYTYQPVQYVVPATPGAGATNIECIPSDPAAPPVRFAFFARPEEALGLLYDRRLCGFATRFRVTDDLGPDGHAQGRVPWYTAGAVRCLEVPDTHISPDDHDH